MPVLQCGNGHVTTDHEVVRCPECGEPVTWRRGWRLEEVPQTGYAPLPAQALVGMGLLMVLAGVIALAMGVPLTIAVGVVLLLVGGSLSLLGGARVLHRSSRPGRPSSN